MKYLQLSSRYNYIKDPTNTDNELRLILLNFTKTYITDYFWLSNPPVQTSSVWQFRGGVIKHKRAFNFKN